MKALDMWQTWCIFTAEPVNNFPKQVGGENGNCSAVFVLSRCVCSFFFFFFFFFVLSSMALVLTTRAHAYPRSRSLSCSVCNHRPGYKACSQNPENCTSTHMAVMNGYISDYVSAVEAVSRYLFA